jgi:hypothetical protein
MTRASVLIHQPFTYPYFVPSVATLSQQIWRHSANRPERVRILSHCSTNTKSTSADDCELPRTQVKRLAADADRPLPPARPLSPRPRAEPGARRDDADWRRDRRLPVLAGLRISDALARAHRWRRRRARAGPRDDRRLYLYPRACGRMDDRAPRFHRRTPSRLKAELAHARADAGLLHARMRRDLDGDGSLRDVAVLLGKDRPRDAQGSADAAGRPDAIADIVSCRLARGRGS